MLSIGNTHATLLSTKSRRVSPKGNACCHSVRTKASTRQPCDEAWHSHSSCCISPTFILDVRECMCYIHTVSMRQTFMLKQNTNNSNTLSVMPDDVPHPQQNSEGSQTTLFKPSLYGGRLTRRPFFLYLLTFSVLLFIIVSLRDFILSQIGHGSSIDIREEMAQTSYWASLLFIHIPATYLFLLPMAVKRAHDIGHKGLFIVTLCSVFHLTQLLYIFAEPYSFLYLELCIFGTSIVYTFILLFKDSKKGQTHTIPLKTQV